VVLQRKIGRVLPSHDNDLVTALSQLLEELCGENFGATDVGPKQF
jgi:hypothetical protein